MIVMEASTVSLASRQAKGHFDVQFVDQSDHASVARACSPTVTLVLIETPSNPLMRVTDIGAIAEIAHSRRQGCG